MKQFNVFVEDKPGQLANVTSCLSKRAVNIVAISSESGISHTNPFIRIVTNDDTTAEHALDHEGFQFNQSDMYLVSLPDRPGELAKIAKKIARRGVNISSFYLVGKNGDRSEVAMGFDDHEKAAEVLSNYNYEFR